MKKLGNGRSANRDSYQNAGRRHGLVRRLSVSSQLQRFAGESQNATRLKLSLLSYFTLLGVFTDEIALQGNVS